jgi:hypothetical protein
MTTRSKKSSAASTKKATKSASAKSKMPSPTKKPAAKKAASSSKKTAPAKKAAAKKPAPAKKTAPAKKPAPAKKAAVKKAEAAPVKESAPSSGGGLSVLDLYDVPTIQQDNWGLWLERLDARSKAVLDKLRTQVASKLEALGVRTLFVPLPVNEKGQFFIDYVWDYAREKFDDVDDEDRSTIIFAVKLDHELRLYFESGGAIAAQHSISKKHQKSLLATLRSELGDRLEWDGKSATVIRVRLT